VEQIDPLAGLVVENLGLDDDQIRQLRTSGTTALGLARWPVGANVLRLSILPEEVAASRRARRLMAAATSGVVVVAGLLGAGGVSEMLSAHSAQAQVRVAEAEETQLQGQITQLTAATAINSELSSRSSLAASALAGDIDWVRTLRQLATIMPVNTTIASFSATRATAGNAGTNSTASSGVGSATFSVNGTGGLPTVAAWLRGLQSDPDLADPWVSGITLNAGSGQVTFTSTADLTPTAESNRAQEMKER
jgi:hypothetical protein